MNTFTLKLLAIFLMILDHVGLFLFPQITILRFIGRLSFPFFAWLIANGYHYSHNRKRYFRRLLIFAVISQVPYSLVFWQDHLSPFQLNIFFTLSFGFLGIVILKEVRDKLFQVVLIVALLSTSLILPVDYGVGGVLSIIAFSYFFNSPYKMVLSQLLIFFTFYSFPQIQHLISRSGQLNPINLLEPVGLGSLFFISQYNKKEGPKITYFFYVFYPTHLLLIYFVKLFI